MMIAGPEPCEDVRQCFDLKPGGLNFSSINKPVTGFETPYGSLEK